MEVVENESEWKSVGEVSSPLIEAIREKVIAHGNFSLLARESGVSIGTIFNVRKGGDLHLSGAEKLVPHLFPGKTLKLD